MSAPLAAGARRLRTLRAQVRTPADAWLLARMLAWRLALPLLKRALPLPRLARLMWRPGSAGRSRAPERAQRVERLVDWLFAERDLGPGDNCLERSLLVYRLFSELGEAPELVIGMRRGDGGAVLGHAWVLVRGEAFRETAESLGPYVRMLSFGERGVQLREPIGASAQDS